MKPTPPLKSSLYRYSSPVPAKTLLSRGRNKIHAIVKYKYHYITLSNSINLKMKSTLTLIATCLLALTMVSCNPVPTSAMLSDASYDNMYGKLKSISLKRSADDDAQFGTPPANAKVPMRPSVDQKDFSDYKYGSGSPDEGVVDDFQSEQNDNDLESGHRDQDVNDYEEDNDAEYGDDTYGDEEEPVVIDGSDLEIIDADNDNESGSHLRTKETEPLDSIEEADDADYSEDNDATDNRPELNEDDVHVDPEFDNENFETSLDTENFETESNSLDDTNFQQDQ